MMSLWQRTRISVNTDGVELSVRDLERGKSRVGALRVIFSWLALLSPTRPFLEVEVSDASLDAADASLDNKPPEPSAPAPRAEWLERLVAVASYALAWAAAVAARDCRLTLRRCRLAAAGVGSLAVEHATADLSLRPPTARRAREPPPGAPLAAATFHRLGAAAAGDRAGAVARVDARARGVSVALGARCASAEVATAAVRYAAGGGGADDAVAAELDCRRCGVLAGDDDAERSVGGLVASLACAVARGDDWALKSGAASVAARGSGRRGDGAVFAATATLKDRRLDVDAQVLGDVDEELPPALARAWARPAARGAPRRVAFDRVDAAVRCAAGLRLGVGGVALVVERGSRAKAKYVDGKFGGAFAFSRVAVEVGGEAVVAARDAKLDAEAAASLRGKLSCEAVDVRASPELVAALSETLADVAPAGGGGGAVELRADVGAVDVTLFGGSDYGDATAFCVAGAARGVHVARTAGGPATVRVRDADARASGPARNSNLPPDFNVRVCDRFDARSSAVLRERDESHRFVQKSADSTSM